MRKRNTTTGANMDLRVRQVHIQKWLEWLSLDGIIKYRQVHIYQQRINNIRVIEADSDLELEAHLLDSDQNEVTIDESNTAFGGLNMQICR